MTPPKCIRPGRVWLVTSSCIGRLFRLVPNRKTVRLTWACLAAAAQKFRGEIRLHAFKFMSNHYHLLVTDVKGVLPAFMEWFNSLLARSLNASRGESGKNFEPPSYQRIALDDAQRQLQAAAYIVTNGCAAHLVSQSRHWKGVSSIHLRFGESKTVKRPGIGLWAAKPSQLQQRRSARSGRDRYSRIVIPAESTMVLHGLPGLAGLDDEEQHAMLMAEVHRLESVYSDERRALQIKVAGWRTVESQHYNTAPSSRRPLFDRRPTFAASTPERRAAMAAEEKSFRRDYYSALHRFQSGDRDVSFPFGTWFMVKRCRANRAPPPAP